MSRKAPLIFSTGFLQVRERVPSTWTMTERPGPFISAASSPMTRGRLALSSRSKKVMTRGSVTPGYVKQCAMSLPSHVSRCSAFASVTVGTPFRAEATIEKTSDSTPVWWFAR